MKYSRLTRVPLLCVFAACLSSVNAQERTQPSEQKGFKSSFAETLLPPAKPSKLPQYKFPGV